MHKMRALLVTLLIAAAACSSTPAEDTPTQQQEGFSPVSEGVLTVATNLPAPGFWNGDDPSQITGGFEYGIAQELAERLGLDDVRVVNVSFDALVAGQARDFDVAFSQVTITDERAEVVDFTEPYYSSDQGVMVRRGTEVPDLAAAKGLRWGVQASTTGQTFVEEEIQPEQEALVYSETTQAFTALQANQIDAVLLDTAIVLSQASQEGSPLASRVGRARWLVARYALAYAVRHHRKTAMHRRFAAVLWWCRSAVKKAKHLVLLAVFYTLVYGRRLFWGAIYYVLVGLRRIGIAPAQWGRDTLSLRTRGK